VNAPALIVVLPLEGKPRVLVDAQNNAEEARLRDWIHAHDDVVALIASALDIAEVRPTA